MAMEARRTPTSRSTSPDSDFQGIFSGFTRLYPSTNVCTGHLVERFGESWYGISHYDQIKPFLITLASVGNHWMFVSSTGALTAGRQNVDHALFPYVTDDQLHTATPHTGSVTLVRIDRSNRTLLWEPFSPRHQGVYRIERSIFKNATGNKVLFEEFNRDLSLRFSYSWQCVNEYGFVRRSQIESTWHLPLRITILDGITNILPSGVSAELHRSRSTLVDAYKVNELEKQVGVYSLSSLIGDHPVPEEALRATLVWQHGPRPSAILLSLDQLDAFREAHSLGTEHSMHGRKGAYLVERSLRLTEERATTWDIIADIDQDTGDLFDLNAELEDTAKIMRSLRKEEKNDTLQLQSLIAGADGLQKTSQTVHDLRHYSNTLFNAMRGGIPLSGYTAEKQDLIRFIEQRHRELASSTYLESLPATFDATHLTPPEDPQLHRLLSEYLPLAYSRRHGDPSRPWNAFEIHTHDDQGNVILDYSGNWRDLFQNWEALGKSFPRYYPAMLATFVNASTADGYNPYRIGRKGLDWEIPDESDPWASIGYWGDHQLIYLLCLLENVDAHDPHRLVEMMHLRMFSYAQVPYRLKTHDQILADPKHSVEFDWDLHHQILERVETTGEDGRLLPSQDGSPILVTLGEKLLVPALTKLSAMVPGAGIWLNTQRPEWNDANNALAGWGCSIVTLFHLHRYLQFLRTLYQPTKASSFEFSSGIVTWMKDVHRALTECRNVSTSSSRLKAMNALGEAASHYRTQLYTHGLEQKTTSVESVFLQKFCSLALTIIQKTLHQVFREDGLVHSYNMLHPTDKAMDVVALQLMLEGQVAALGSHSLTTPQAIALLNALKDSSLYSQHHGSYLLYADQRLAHFSERNQIPPNEVVRVSIVRKLVKKGDKRLITRSANGYFHFSPALINATALEDTLDTLQSEGYKISEENRTRIIELYEKTFQHASFTGRSGRFFKYEGLGCVYWHIVSKLLLAVQSAFWQAVDSNAPETSRKILLRHYYDIRNGLGAAQTPAKYGAFPQDAYSHTPKWGGAQQPGLTGQVKEDMLSRLGELGIRITDGFIRIHPALLRKSEFLQKPEEFKWYDLNGELKSIQLYEGQLAFTYCQVLFVYHISSEPLLKIRGSYEMERPDLVFSYEESADIFGRTGSITRVDVFLHPWNP
ncbi:MAG: hypothetical protein OXF84_12195 [Bacteroidetes bacterium]|nr:hypothetical protein [Bacteroidota bacterium]